MLYRILSVFLKEWLGDFERNLPEARREGLFGVEGLLQGCSHREEHAEQMGNVSVARQGGDVAWV